MSKFEKSILAIILSAGIGNVAMIGKFDASIENLNQNISKLDLNINSIDNRVRAIEIEQAKLNALHSLNNNELALN